MNKPGIPVLPTLGLFFAALSVAVDRLPAADFAVKQLTEASYTDLGGNRRTDIGLEPRHLAAAGSRIYFSGNVVTSGTRREPCFVDLAANSVGILKTIYPAAGSDPDSFTRVGPVVYFAAADSSNGRELWKTDGTEAGTVLVKNIRPGPTSSNPALLREFNGKLIFTADDGTTGQELWTSDGTIAGTVAVKDIWPGASTSSVGNMTEWRDVLYFSAADGVNNAELWRSDGTAGGTFMLKDLATSNSHPRGFISYQGYLYFQATASTGQGIGQLWRTDGTVGGTVLIRNFPNSSAALNSFTIANNLLFFTAPLEGTSSDVELWRSDGSSGGTFMVKNINVNGNYENGSFFFPHNLVAFKEGIYFVANDGIRGDQIWRSNGTAAGTVTVHEIYNPLTWPAPRPSRLLVHRGVLLFAQKRDGSGREWWQTDGTAEGLKPVIDLNPGNGDALEESGFADSEYLIAADRLVFAARNASSGSELWAFTGDPVVPQPPKVESLVVRAGATNSMSVSIRFTSVPGARYRIEGTSDLQSGPWTSVMDVNSEGPATTADFTNTSPVDRGFWRVILLN